MKRIIILLSFFALIITSGYTCDISSLISSYDKNLVLIEFISGNFTGSNYAEYIGFFDTTQKYSEQKEKSVNKVICFLIDNGKIMKSIELSGYQSSLFDNTKKYYNIKMMNFDELGKKFSFGWVGDLNNNKLDEVFVYQVTSWGFYPSVYEYNNGSFRKILNYETAYTELISVNKDLKSMTFLEYGNNKHNVTFVWNPTNNEYRQDK